MEQYTLVILCGGRSVRMGTDKALLPFGNCCLLEYMVQRFSPFFHKIYLSVRERGDYTHLNLDVTEIPDVYINAGPLSGIFSALTMINEDAAFVISVDTPFVEPELGRYLFNHLENYDICAVTRADDRLETLYAVFKKSCTTTIGKCLLLKQYSLMNLQQKCNTRYIAEEDLRKTVLPPLDSQLFDLSTRASYYQALTMLYRISKNAFGENFMIGAPTASSTNQIPSLCFVSHPVLDAESYIERLLPILQKDGLRVAYLQNNDSADSFEACLSAVKNVDLILINGYETADIPKLEILRKGILEEPEHEDTAAVICDFSYKGSHLSFDYNRPRSIISFLRNYILDHTY